MIGVDGFCIYLTQHETIIPQNTVVDEQITIETTDVVTHDLLSTAQTVQMNIVTT